MKKQIYISLLFLSVFILSCKKDSLNTPSNHKNSNNTIQNSPLTNGLPNNIHSINGVLLANKLYDPSMNFTSYSSYAGFFNTSVPLTYINPLSFLILGNDDADTVKINNTILKLRITNTQNNATIYTDTTTTPIYSDTVSWFVKGNSNFASFNTTVTRGFPIINNPAIIPSSFSKTQPLTINLSIGNISNADSIIVEIQDHINNAYSITKSIGGAANSVNFTSNELAGFVVNDYSSQISIYVKNYSNIIVNDKTHVFIMCYTLSDFQTVNP